jgi:uncharacterized phage infection (PIP) family protein YhgE
MTRSKGTEKRVNRKQVTYSQRELEQLQEDFSKSSCGMITQYIREVSLKSPFDIYRNRAFDQFVEEVIVLRKEMQGIRENMVHTKENEIRLIQLHEEIKSSINKLMDICMQE